MSTKNRQIAEAVFHKMREFGFQPYDIVYGNGYFVFNYGEDSVIHFRVKGVWKHWKFGMWVSSEYLDKPDDKKDEYPMVELFAQYDTQIDKFKPSRSDLLVNFMTTDWTDSDFTKGIGYFELERMLKMMHKHPLLCYHGICGEYAGYTDKEFLKEFIVQEGMEYFELVNKAVKTALFLPYTKFKIFLAKRDKYVKSITLYDFEKENPGWKTSYLYEVRIVFVNNVTDEQIGNWMNRWFKKKKYGRFGYYDYVIEVESFQIDGVKGVFGMVEVSE